MGQDSCTETASLSTQHSRSAYLLMGVGILWLLLAAVLLIYQLANPVSVEITWETATELRTAGFHVYRSSDPASGFGLINEGHLINSKGDPVSGAHYSFIDNDVKAGKTYYYILEEVEFDASINRYEDEVFEYTVPEINWWAAILTFGSALIGIVLLVSGLKEKTKQ